MSEKKTASVIHQGQVFVKCILPIQIIQELEIVRKINEHGQLFVKGILDENGKDAIEQIGSQEPVIVYVKNNSGETILFSGVISEADVCFKDGIYYASIKGLSWSSLLDYEKKSRSFQNKNATYTEVLSKIVSDYAKGMFLYDTNVQDRNIGQFILQYRETDWEFCKRLATHFNTSLVPDVKGDSPRFCFGLPRKTEQMEVVEQKVIQRDDAAYQQALQGGFFVSKEQFIKYHVNTPVLLELGSVVEYAKQKLIIEACHLSLDKSVLSNTYVLSREEALLTGKINNELIKGVSLIGNVLKSENQRIKLKLEIDNEQDTDAACWFPYASQANNLFYCMPEVGTSVSLYFPGADEAKCIAMNAVRRNGGSCAKTSNPDMKYMGTPEGKEFKLGSTDIDFTAHEKLFMSLDNNKGVTIQSDKDMNVFTRQKLLMEAKELIKIYSTTGNIVAGANEKSSLYLIGGADGDTHIKAGNNIVYDGRKKEVFTERLNKEIAYEEKKFDWGKLAKNALIGLAAVAAVVAVVATGGAALVALGAVTASTVGSVAMGAAISGAIAVGFTAASDIMRGEVSDWKDYALAGLKGAIEGAVSGAVLGLKAFEGAKLLGKMFISGGTSFITDAMGQGLDWLVNGKPYDWKQGLVSFGIGFLMPAGAAGMRKMIAKYGKNMPYWLRKSFCNLCGDPVDVINGSVIYDATDFELPGPIPLQWNRIWCSSSMIVGHLGHGTRYSYEMGLEIYKEECTIIVFLNDGRVAAFPQLMVGEEYFDYKNKLNLKRMSDSYQVFDPEARLVYTLSPIDNGYIAYKLTKVENKTGHCIEFNYDDSGYLCQIVDSAGRQLDVSTNGEGRITDICLNENNNRHRLVSYSYNKEQDLSGVTDALGKTTSMDYRNHLMTKKTDREKNSFYWEYDKYEDGARAVRSWGDGGVLSLWIDYHDDEMYNAVRSGKNKKACEYHYNENRLCVRTVYPDLTEIRENYDDKYQLISRIDEEGRQTKYTYNELSLITGIIRPDSSKIQLEYDEEGRLIKKQNPEGDCVEWVYNEDDTLMKTIDENGAESVFTYNQDKLVEKICNPDGEAIMLTYDGHNNLRKVVLPNGCMSEWKYDYRGNCLSYRSPLGAVETYDYDSLNRLVHAKLADGNEVTLGYNSYEDVIRAKDKHTEVAFTYDILGNVISRTEGERKLQYKYNSEAQLISIINEKGETYDFERDEKGNVVKERGFDKQIRTYELDYSGLVKKANRPGGRFTKYTYDKLCRVIRTDYHDKSYEEYVYNKNGLLTEVKNQYTAIKLERDKSGRIQKEWQDNHWVASDYDSSGNRRAVSSSFGANILSKRDKMGQVTHMVAYLNKEKPWCARMEYNVTGQEVARKVSGGVIGNFSYDEAGRPVQHMIRGQKESIHRHRRYEWDVNYRLEKVTNELTKGNIIYSYDRFSNLISARGTEILSCFRMFDEAGNVYGTEDKSDRIYGAGSRLETSGIDLKEKRNIYQGGHGRLVTKGAEYFYDEEGNLVRKTEADGSIWEYSYYGNGMLRKVVRPDKSAVIFKYDGLGRRIEKSITRAGSEKVIPFARKEAAWEESKWETIGGVRIRRPNTELQKPHTLQGDNTSVYRGENALQPGSEQKASHVEKVIKFLWDGNVLLHEWQEDAEESKKPVSQIDYQAEYVVKLSEKKEQEGREKAAKGEPAPESLITWIFQDDFIPRARITKDGIYSIMTDYLGTPAEAYDDSGTLVWNREMDINGNVMPAGKDRYGRTMEDIGEKNFIPFRFQGQYEDEETGLYYNRFRYYNPETGQYTQQDPIGLAGGNPTLYGYVYDTNIWFDLFGLEPFFRSMSRAEFFDIQDFGWRACENGMSGKWFADSFEDAIIFGQRMGHGVDPKFYVVEVDIPEDIIKKAFRVSSNHDGIGAASYFEVADLNSGGVTIKSRNTIRANREQQVLGGCKG